MKFNLPLTCVFAGLILVGCGGESPAPVAGAASESPMAGSVKTPSAVEAVAAPAESDDGNCDVTVEGPGRTKVGQEAVATVSLRATGGYKLNQEAPFSVQIGEGPLTVGKTKLSIDDASVAAPHEVQMEIPFSSAAAGEHSLEIHARFGVCSDEDCGFCRKKRQLHTVVD